MDCRIIDSKIVVRSGSVVSVPANHFSDEGREERYFGTDLRRTQDNEAHVKWFEDDSVSLEEVAVLNLETEVPKKDKPKFKLRIKPVREIPPKDDIDFTEIVILHQNIVSPNHHLDLHIEQVAQHQLITEKKKVMKAKAVMMKVVSAHISAF